MTAIETPLGAESQSLAPFLFSCEEIAEYEIHSPVKLQKALRLVCSRLNKGDGISATYKDSLRRTYQQLNLILNVQFAQHRLGAVPPWLRDHPRITYTNQLRGYESDFSNDSQVIDLHFFHCMGHRICAHKDGHSALGIDEFDFEAAHRFARYGGSKAQKIASLYLANSAGVKSCHLGAHVLVSDKLKSSRLDLAQRATALTEQLRMLSRSNNKKPRAWAEAYLAGEHLAALNAKINGPALDEMQAVLFGYSRQDRQDPRLFLRPWKMACKLLNKPVPET
jgi:hypothetical protein